jgi:hypothetical protein
VKHYPWAKSHTISRVGDGLVLREEGNGTYHLTQTGVQTFTFSQDDGQYHKNGEIQFSGFTIEGTAGGENQFGRVKAEGAQILEATYEFAKDLRRAGGDLNSHIREYKKMQ